MFLSLPQVHHHFAACILNAFTAVFLLKEQLNYFLKLFELLYDVFTTVGLEEKDGLDNSKFIQSISMHTHRILFFYYFFSFISFQSFSIGSIFTSYMHLIFLSHTDNFPT